MKAYVVLGHTGEYSDYYTWMVASYTDRYRALQHRDLANDWTKQFGGKHWGGSWAHDAEEEYRKRRSEKGGPYDPDLHMDYTGSWYTISVIDHDPENFKEIERATLFEKEIT